MIITINTDASFSIEYKFGTYAYWIKSNDFLYKGSWVFKDKVKWSTNAEAQAVCIALWLLKNNEKDFTKIIVNCDNKYVTNKGRGYLVKMINKYIAEYFNHINKLHGSRKRKIEFRHVKAHQEIIDSRTYVNDWCDRACKREFYEYKEIFLENI